MHRYASQRLGVLVVAGVCLLAGLAPQALALPAVQNVLGRYDGFYQSAINMDDRAPMQLLITEQDGRRFAGSAQLPAVQFPVVGTISRDGHLVIAGRNAMGWLQAQGTAEFFDDGSAFVQMDYRFWPWPQSRSFDRGLMVLVRDTGFNAAPEVTGTWDGTYESRVNRADTGPVAVEIGSQEGSRFDGEMMLGDGSVFPLAGTIGAPSPGYPPNPCHFVGLGSAGWLLVSGLLLPAVQDADGSVVPAEFHGEYRMVFGDGSVRVGVLDLVQRVQRGE